MLQPQVLHQYFQTLVFIIQKKLHSLGFTKQLSFNTELRDEVQKFTNNILQLYQVYSKKMFEMVSLGNSTHQSLIIQFIETFERKIEFLIFDKEQKLLKSQILQCVAKHLVFVTDKCKSAKESQEKQEQMSGQERERNSQLLESIEIFRKQLCKQKQVGEYGFGSEAPFKVQIRRKEEAKRNIDLELELKIELEMKKDKDKEKKKMKKKKAKESKKEEEEKDLEYEMIMGKINSLSEVKQRVIIKVSEQFLNNLRLDDPNSEGENNQLVQGIREDQDEESDNNA